jgi:hypothetical protein
MCAMIKNLKDTYGRTPEQACDIINKMGGTSEAARTIGITPQAMSYWRRKGIPVVWLKVLRQSHKALFPAPVKPSAKQPKQHTCPSCGHVYTDNP